MASQGLIYDGCNFFRQRLVLSTLSGKRVKVKNIRSKDDNPGLRGEFSSFTPHVASQLALKLTGASCYAVGSVFNHWAPEVEK